MKRSAVVVLGILGTLACGRPSPRGPDVYGYRVRTADPDPVVVERAPRMYYRGAWAHLVYGEWYYPTETGWVVFEETPPESDQTAGTVVARRKANFAAAVGATSEWRSRLDASVVTV